MHDPDLLILEGIVTSLDAEGAVNIAPMGPRVDASMKRLLLRPFKTAKTYQNLKESGEGVFHVVDDVLLLARAAVGPVDPPPFMVPATQVRGYILQDACRFYEFRIRRVQEVEERVTMEAVVVAQGRLHDFLGFNRARHAVVEAAILATRIHLLPAADIEAEYQRLKVLVDKTGGQREHEAFAFLEEFVQASGQQTEKTSPSVEGPLP